MRMSFIGDKMAKKIPVVLFLIMIFSVSVTSEEKPFQPTLQKGIEGIFIQVNRTTIDRRTMKSKTIPLTPGELATWINNGKFDDTEAIKKIMDTHGIEWNKDNLEGILKSLLKLSYRVINQIWSDIIDKLKNCDEFGKAHNGKVKKEFEKYIKKRKQIIEFKWLSLALGESNSKKRKIHLSKDAFFYSLFEFFANKHPEVHGAENLHIKDYDDPASNRTLYMLRAILGHEMLHAFTDIYKEGQKGKLYLVTKKGLIEYAPATKLSKLLLEITGLDSQYITLFFDSGNTFWLGTNRGVFKQENNGSWTQFTTSDGLSSNKVYFASL